MSKSGVLSWCLTVERLATTLDQALDDGRSDAMQPTEAQQQVGRWLHGVTALANGNTHSPWLEPTKDGLDSLHLHSIVHDPVYPLGPLPMPLEQVGHALLSGTVDPPGWDILERLAKHIDAELARTRRQI